MSTRGSAQTPSRPPWPLLGLMLVVLVLIHDVLMASEALAAPHRLMARAQQTMASSMPREHLAPSSSAPGPAHPENCQIGLSGILPTADDMAGDVQGAPVSAVFSSITPLPTWRSGGFVWPEPHWPPGTQRALFQVYRI